MQLSTLNRPAAPIRRETRTLGFTLVDSLVALALLGTLVVFSTTVLGHLRRYHHHAQLEQAAIRLTAAALESAVMTETRSPENRSHGVALQGDGVAPFEVSVTTEPDAGRGLAKVTATTRWTDHQGVRRAVSMATWKPVAPSREPGP